MREKLEKKNYRAKEAAKVFGVGLSTIWAYAKQGKLHPKKISDKVTVFNADELHKFFKVEA